MDAMQAIKKSHIVKQNNAQFIIFIDIHFMEFRLFAIVNKKKISKYKIICFKI